MSHNQAQSALVSSCKNPGKGRNVRISNSRWTVVLLLSLLALSTPVEEATAADEKTAKGTATRPDDLSALLEPIRERHELPALGAAIVTADRLVGLGATGRRKSGGKEAVTKADSWHIGSCGKAMTATLIARLVEKRKLRWETTIGQAFPKLRKSLRPEYRDVTLEQLLAHRGGLTGDLVNEHPALWRRLRFFSGSPRKARALLVAEVLKTTPVAEPGTKFVYSNAGYVIAGAIAEQATGKSWEDLMQREVFRPLGMSSAGFGAPEKKQPWGHLATPNGGKPMAPGPLADNPVALAPAGTVHCSLEDWARFVALHIGASKTDEKSRKKRKRFLTEASLEKLHAPVAESDYALGWVTGDRGWGGGPILNHAGTNTMWYAVVWAAPEREFAILITTNQGGQSEACDEAFGVLLKYYRERSRDG